MARRTGTFLIALALAVAAAPAAFAQSFDCAKATTADEGAICGSRALSELDDKMAKIYDEAARCALMGTRGDLLDSQRAFLAKRAECGASVPCLRNIYHGRISELEKIKASIGQGAC